MYNIIPTNDLKPHIFGEDCKCNPIIVTEDNVSVLVHHAYDCRELIEQIFEKENSN